VSIKLHHSIGPHTHGIIDYASVIMLAVAPRVTGFSGKQAVFCYTLAVVHLALTLLTRFPLGAVKVIGFPLHGAIEFIVSLLLIALPWLANFSNGVLSTRFFVAFGLLLFVIWLLTDYRGRRGGVVVSG
jgi:hypothetical protein